MKSIDVKDFDFTLRKFIEGYDLPVEVKRLVIKDIYNDITVQANDECMVQAKEREENKNA